MDGPLVDNHLDLRDGGVIQIFNSPHPTKNTGNSYWDSKKAPNLMAYMNIPTEDLDSDSSLENIIIGLEFQGNLQFSFCFYHKIVIFVRIEMNEKIVYKTCSQAPSGLFSIKDRKWMGTGSCTYGGPFICLHRDRQKWKVLGRKKKHYSCPLCVIFESSKSFQFLVISKFFNSYTPLLTFLYTPYNKHITKWLF